MWDTQSSIGSGDPSSLDGSLRLVNHRGPSVSVAPFGLPTGGVEDRDRRCTFEVGPPVSGNPTPVYQSQVSGRRRHTIRPLLRDPLLFPVLVPSEAHSTTQTTEGPLGFCGPDPSLSRSRENCGKNIFKIHVYISICMCVHGSPRISNA